MEEPNPVDLDDNFMEDTEARESEHKREGDDAEEIEAERPMKRSRLEFLDDQAVEILEAKQKKELSFQNIEPEKREKFVTAMKKEIITSAPEHIRRSRQRNRNRSDGRSQRRYYNRAMSS